MKKNLIVSALIVLLFLSCQTKGETTVRTIAVSAISTVSVEPDSATFSISAESVEETTVLARSNTSALLDKAVKILKEEYGISSSDIVTGYINVGPYYEWNDSGRVLKGQRASQSVTITVKDITKLSNILDSITSLDKISVGSITVDKLDKTETQRKARELATKDAREKAEAYAEGAGLKVGEVLSISDGTSVSYEPLYENALYAKASSAQDSGSVSLSYYAGTVKISDKVSIVYRLIDK